MDVSQALGFNLLLREFKELMPPSVVDALQPWFDKAQAKLKQESHAKASRWSQKIAIRPQGPPLLAAKALRSTVDTVSDALFSDRQIKADYRSAQSPTYRQVHLHPLGLVRTGLVTYLVATFDGFSDPRLLALHRLRGVQLLPQETVTPQGFVLDEYLGQDRLNFGSGKKVQLRLRMSAGAAAHLHDTPLSKDQAIEALQDVPPVVQVSATVGESPRLIWWLLGFGKQVEVLEPESVRQSIRKIRGN